MSIMNPKARPVVGNPESSLSRPFRRLFLDLEVSPNLVLSWKTGYKIDLSPDSIVKERQIICAAWRWEGESKTYSATWDKDQDDRLLVLKLVSVLSEADEVVGHNLAAFDLPWIKARALYHGIVTSGEYKVVDTCLLARRHFYLNSNKLDYIARFLGLGGKLKTGFDLWKEIVLERSAKALSKMVSYCCVDTELLEQVYLRIAKSVPQVSHLGVMRGGEKWSCPRTGSTEVILSKTRVSARGSITYQMKSVRDGSYFTIGAPAYKAYCAAKGRKARLAS